MTQAQAADQSTSVKPDFEVCSQLMVITIFPFLFSSHKEDIDLMLFLNCFFK